MKILEFFGLPYSGKSYYVDYCEKFFEKKTKVYDNKSIFLRYLLIKNKISYFYYLILLFRYKNFKKKTKEKNTYKFSLVKKKIKKKKLLYKKFFYLTREKYRLFKLSKKKYSSFYEYCIKLIKLENSFYRRKKLKRWLVDEFNAYFLAKNNEIPGLMILSESFVQRIHSYYLNLDQIDEIAVKQYLNLMPYSDYIFFVNSDIEIIKSRLNRKITNEKEKFYFENIENLNNKMNLIKKKLIKKEVNVISNSNQLKKIITNKNFVNYD